MIGKANFPEQCVNHMLPEMLDAADSFGSGLASPHHQDIGGIMRILPSDVNVSHMQR
mgnify:FL=1